jgi:hypothetical protein
MFRTIFEFCTRFISPVKFYLAAAGLALLVSYFGVMKIKSLWNEHTRANLETQVQNQQHEIQSLQTAAAETKKTIEILNEQRQRDAARTATLRKKKSVIKAKEVQTIADIESVGPDKDGTVAPVVTEVLIKINADRTAPQEK